MLWNIALKSVLRDEPRMATFKTIHIYRVQYPFLFTFLCLLYFITKPIEFILKCKENELQ